VGSLIRAVSAATSRSPPVSASGLRLQTRCRAADPGRRTDYGSCYAWVLVFLFKLLFVLYVRSETPLLLWSNESCGVAKQPTLRRHLPLDIMPLRCRGRAVVNRKCESKMRARRYASTRSGGPRVFSRIGEDAHILGPPHGDDLLERDAVRSFGSYFPTAHNRLGDAHPVGKLDLGKLVAKANSADYPPKVRAFFQIPQHMAIVCHGKCRCQGKKGTLREG